MTRVSDYILARLADEGVTHFTHVYGAACGELLDAVTRQERIKHVCFLHEQAAAFAAEGISKSGGFGVCIVTSGPGGQNTVTGIGNAFYDSVPLLVITGQVNSKFMRPNESIRQLGFQECDIVGIVKPITKYAVTVKDPQRIRYELEKAIWLAKNDRSGPCLLDIPIDVQKAEIEPEKLEGFAPNRLEWVNAAVDDAIDSYLKALATAKRPVLLIGGGCANYKEEFHVLASRLQIPCFPTWNALDIVTSDSPYYGGRIGTYGGAGRNFGIANTDLLLSIGSRISGRITGGIPESWCRAGKRYFVDVDPALLVPKWQPVKADLNILCDAGAFMRRLAERAKPAKVDEWLALCRHWREKYDPVTDAHREHWHTYGFLRYLSELMPNNAIIVNDTGGAVISASHAFETKRGQRYFTNNSNTPMGFSMCGAIGAWIQTKKPVYCLIGDGGMNLNIQELKTIERYNADIRIFVLNNGCYANTKLYEFLNYGGRYIGCDKPDYSPPDFVKIAKAYGVKAYTIDSKWKAGNQSYQPNTMDEWLPRLMGTPGPWLCDVVHEGFFDYSPRMTMWNAGVEEMHPPLSQDEFRKNMIVAPVDGWEERQKLHKPIVE